MLELQILIVLKISCFHVNFIHCIIVFHLFLSLYLFVHVIVCCSPWFYTKFVLNQNASGYFLLSSALSKIQSKIISQVSCYGVSISLCIFHLIRLWNKRKKTLFLVLVSVIGLRNTMWQRPPRCIILSVIRFLTFTRSSVLIIIFAFRLFIC